MRVRLLPEAEDDLSEAAAFLEQRVVGLGIRLVADVESAFARLEENAYVGPHLGRGVRKLRVNRFPYNVIYRILFRRSSDSCGGPSSQASIVLAQPRLTCRPRTVTSNGMALGA